VNEWVIFNGSLSAAQTNTVPGTYSGTIHVLATPN
jgi:spore coat protein U-like protein